MLQHWFLRTFIFHLSQTDFTFYIEGRLSIENFIQSFNLCAVLTIEKEYPMVSLLCYRVNNRIRNITAVMEGLKNPSSFPLFFMALISLDQTGDPLQRCSLLQTVGGSGCGSPSILFTGIKWPATAKLDACPMYRATLSSSSRPPHLSPHNLIGGNHLASLCEQLLNLPSMNRSNQKVKKWGKGIDLLPLPWNTVKCLYQTTCEIQQSKAGAVSHSW